MPVAFFEMHSELDETIGYEEDLSQAMFFEVRVISINLSRHTFNHFFT